MCHLNSLCKLRGRSPLRPSLLTLVAAVQTCDAWIASGAIALSDNATTTTLLQLRYADTRWATQPMDVGSSTPGHAAAGSCAALCEASDTCRCTGRVHSSAECWQHPSCDLREIAAAHKADSGVSVKVTAPWLLVGAALSNNTCRRVATSDREAAHATSRDLVAGISVRARSGVRVGLTSSSSSGHYVELLADGRWSLPGGAHVQAGDSVALRVRAPSGAPPEPQAGCNEAEWPDQSLRCGECKVLVAWPASGAYETCAGYCRARGRVCMNAWQSFGTCDTWGSSACDTVSTSTSGICECGSELREVVAIFDGREVWLGDALADAMHAELVLTGPNSSAEVLEVIPEPFFGEVVSTTYHTLEHRNAYAGHGATEIDVGEQGGRPHMTAQDCQDWCTRDLTCDCVSWGREADPWTRHARTNMYKCWRRRDCYPHGVTDSPYDSNFNVYMKQRMRWRRMAAAFANNTFSKAAWGYAGSAIATSAEPVRSITVRGGARGMVGLAASAALEAGFADGLYLSFADGSLSGAGLPGALQFSPDDEVTIQVLNHTVHAVLRGQQIVMGHGSVGALHAKIVLQEPGSSVELVDVVPAPEAPAREEPQGHRLAVWLGIGLSTVVLLCCAGGAVAVTAHCTDPGGGRGCKPDPEPARSTSPLPNLLGSLRLPSAMAAVKAPITPDQKSRHPAWAAISLAQLNELRDRAVEKLGSDYPTATMHDVNREVLQPLCEAHGKSYAHIVNEDELLHVTVFVSHAWQENFDMFVNSINTALSHWIVKPNLWICATALLQTTDPTIISMQVGTGQDLSRAPFTQALAQAEKMLVVRNDAVDLYERIWCCWELFLAHEQGLVHRPGALLVEGPAAPPGRPVDITTASASNSEDKRRILLHILSSNSYQAINEKLTEVKYFVAGQVGLVEV